MKRNKKSWLGLMVAVLLMTAVVLAFSLITGTPAAQAADEVPGGGGGSCSSWTYSGGCCANGFAEQKRYCPGSGWQYRCPNGGLICAP